MGEQEFSEMLQTALEADLCAEERAALPDELAEALDAVRGVRSFRDAQVLTSNSGFVVELQDGSRFAVTVQEMR